MDIRTRSVLLAIAAAIFYALNAPFAKALLFSMGSGVLAGFLYIGAGVGMAAVMAVRFLAKGRPDNLLARSDLGYVVAMVALDTLAPLLMMAGLAQSSAESVSLLNNFEIVATALIARIAFKEMINRKLWLGITAVTLSCILLVWEPSSSLSFSWGSLLVIGACLCWGLENNCTAKISERDSVQIVMIKGLGSGISALAIALLLGETIPDAGFAGLAMLLGFASYGLSIVTYILAQRGIGAARTSAYYSIAPFVGVLISWALYGLTPNPIFYIALALMAVGAWLSMPETESYGDDGLSRQSEVLTESR